ncbi:MAG: methionine synthase, partial [Planctomycetota bacterium]
RFDWAAQPPAPPRRPGRHLLDRIALAELEPYLDWTPFFAAWELPGRFPELLEDPRHGRQARELHRDALALLARIREQELLQARGVLALLPAAAEGDDLVVYAGEDRCRIRARLPMLRQQRRGRAGETNLCLADFVAPADSGVPDWLGLFAVTAGHGAAELAASYEEEGDDYSAILVRALADRLAEAFAEFLHERVRRDYWGYEKGPPATPEQLLAEAYRGIRPAPGYPACPDHGLKRRIFDLLDAERAAGLRLTGTGAVEPAASVCGLILAHPKASYFGVGRIGRDQLEDYAGRCEADPAELARGLGLAVEDSPAQAGSATTP